MLYKEKFCLRFSSIFLVVLTLVVGCFSMELKENQRAKYWNQFKLHYNKNIPSDQDLFREATFWKNLQTVVRHNHAFRQGKAPFKIEISDYADIVAGDYVSYYLLQVKNTKKDNLMKSEDFRTETVENNEGPDTFKDDNGTPAIGRRFCGADRLNGNV